ncbi:MAG: TetR/AcrR family transcriptional regulator [Xanthomonadales bacterium]|nr:TetR/AcrR family transcriptional regulator [Xanthomonadales bacterium]NNL95210.1 TetR/AcrR family transcriptional regulator [Xanthomonadales bacterium]
MASRGASTRNKILEVAEQIILKKGFSATSIEEIIGQAHITKSGFFYHFAGKNELAQGLVDRFLVEDARIFNEMMERARSLSEDPLQQMLIFMKLMAEMMADIPNGHPGCLVASFTYESMQFDQQVLDGVRQGMLDWRTIFGEQLQRVADAYPMKIETSVDDLADGITTAMEGGIVVSLTIGDPEILVRQLLIYRNHLRLLFGDVS